LLDADRGGHFAIAPAVPCTATRRYVGETNVLETTFACDGGEATLVDLMPVLTEEEKRHRLTPFRQILRRVECVRGEVPIAVDFVPRPDYARVVPRLALRHDRVCCAWGARVLKLLTYAPSGGIVAATTTSLPEKIGGIRNWDYRYCWLRDASFTVSALYDCGFEREGAAFLDWLLYSTRLTQPRLQILYDIFGESHLPERELKHLDGYRGSQPLRFGNDAHDQVQLA